MVLDIIQFVFMVTNLNQLNVVSEMTLLMGHTQANMTMLEALEVSCKTVGQKAEWIETNLVIKPVSAPQFVREN